MKRTWPPCSPAPRASRTPAWKPGFYPADVPASRFLTHYASRLNATEVNYQLQALAVGLDLGGLGRQEAQPHFLFAMKAHQRITHWLRLKGAEEATRFFLEALAPLRDRERLGPVLLQLPPDLQRDDERLAAYLALLPADLRFAFEFRHTSWFTDEVSTCCAATTWRCAWLSPRPW